MKKRAEEGRGRECSVSINRKMDDFYYHTNFEESFLCNT